jgi:glycosyltransferase involved in cell wall biosynthesis
MSRILLLSPYPPFPPHGGGAQRIYQILRGLAQGHDLTCLTFAPSPAAAARLEALRAICRLEIVAGPQPRSLPRRAWTTLASPLPDMALRNASAAYEAALRSLLAEHFDVVQAESIEMARYLAVARRAVAVGASDSRHSAWNRRATFPSALHVLDEFNAEYLLQRRAAQTSLQALLRLSAGLRARTLLQSQARNLAGGLYSLAQAGKLARYERAVIAQADATVVVSPDDQRALQRVAGPFETAIVPNGVDLAYFAPRRAASLVPTLVFSGTMDYRPNVDAARWFVAEVLPRIRAQRPDVRAQLVGRAPAPAVQALAAEGAVEVTGEVDDVRDYLAAAAVYVVPMRIGGGIRLKLLEALAMEAPVVSTSLGAEGVGELAHERHCLLADEAPAFAAAVLRLLDDRTLARSLAVAGRRLAAAYDWSALIPRLDALYSRLARKP